MKKYVFMIIAGMVFACKSNSVDKKEEGLKYKETITINDVPKATLTFFEVDEDSRCPEGGVCVWAGRVVVDLQFTGVTTEGGVQEHAKMCMGTCGSGQFGPDTLLKKFAGENYQLVLTEVNPSPKVGVERKKEDYAIMLKVEKK